MASIFTGFSSASHKPDLRPFKRRLYLSNGWDPVRVWNGIATTDAQAGIVGPGIEPTDWTPAGTQAASGSVTVGAHKVRYRYKDSETGYVSNPSNEFTVNVTVASQKLQFPVVASGAATNALVSADSKVDTIVIEMTDIGNQNFFIAAEGPNIAGTIEVTRSDTQLREEGEFPYPELQHSLPPVARYLLAFKDRLFAFGQVKHSDGTVAATNGSATLTGTGTNWTAAAVGRFVQFDGENVTYEIEAFVSATELTLKSTYAGSTGSSKSYTLFSRSNLIFFSHASYPESWPSSNFFEALSGEDATAVIGFGNALVIFGLRTIERFTYGDSVLATGEKRPVPGTRGALNQDVVVVVDNRVYSMDQTGMFVYDGSEPRHISRPVDARIRDQVDFNFASKFHGVFYPKLRAIRWFLVQSGDTECKLYLEFDVDREVWGSGSLDFAITFTAQAPRTQGIGVLAGDEGGGQWWDDEGTTIGANSSIANGTVDAGATTTSIPLKTSTLPTSGNGLVGVPVYFPATGEVRRVQSNTATTLVLDTAVALAPSEDASCYLGRVVGKLRTKSFTVANDFKEKNRGTWVYLKFKPVTAQRLMRLRVFEDESETARSDWGAASYATAHASNEGVTVPGAGETDWLVDLSKSDGTVRLPLGIKAMRTFSVELEADQPDTALQLYSIQIGAMHERSQL